MFKFYCGLVDFQNKLQQFDDVIEHKTSILYMFHCAYETQLESICHQVLIFMQGSLCIESCILTPADFHVLAYVVSAASHLVKQVMILPCILYEEYNEKWKNKKIGHAELLSSSFAQSNFDFPSIKSKFEYDICNQVSYKKLKYFSVTELEQQIIGILSISTFQEFSTVYQSCSDIFSSENAAPLANALKHCGNIEKLYLYGIFNSMETASLLRDVLKNSPNLISFNVYEYSSFKAEYLIIGLQQCCKSAVLALKGTDLHGKLMADLSCLLTQCTDLKLLVLNYCSIQSQDALTLAKALTNSSLNVLNLCYNNIGSEGMQSLAKYIHCEQLYLTSCNIGSEGAKHLAEYLVKNPSVTMLCLQNNNIGSQGITALAEGLRHCSNLQVLLLSFNNVEYYGAVALAQGLMFCSQLECLDLNGCNLNTGGDLHIIEPFHWNKLVCLELSNNGITSNNILPALAQRMKYLKFLKKLSLSTNSINNSAAIALAEGIQNCPSLLDLNVSDNNIGSDGAMVLAKAIIFPNTRNISSFVEGISTTILVMGLQQDIEPTLYIDFSRNKLDDSCIDSLIALAKSRKRVKLDLSYNNIGPNGSERLVTELMNFEFPLQVNLVHNNISDKEVKRLNHTLQTEKLHTRQFKVFF